jgi:undecaprenyl diphosphate synthase
MSVSAMASLRPRPRHVAVIMDGNGRWARARGLPRTAGHQQGVQAVRRTVEAAAALGIEILTLFGFSSENWKRPAEEVGELMRLLRFYLRAETAELHKNNVRLRVVGDRSGLDRDIVTLIEGAEDLTRLNDKVTVVIALNYGGRDEIVRAATRMAADFQTRGIAPEPERVAAHFPDYLMTAGLPDPDLLIRTSGERRISNFMLWQCAYAELLFLDTLWPDFGRADLEAALADYAGRERRFGALPPGEVSVEY